MPPRRSRHQPLQAEQPSDSVPQADPQPQPQPQTQPAAQQTDSENDQTGSSKAKGKGKGKGKGGGKGKVDQQKGEDLEREKEQEHEQTDDSRDQHDVTATAAATATATDTTTADTRLTMQGRMEKMKQLKQKMAASSKSNRSALLAEQSKQRQSAKSLAAQERKMARAEAELDLRDMRERGEDIERNKNWNYSIQDGENWEEKLEAKEQRMDPGAVDFTSAAARSYARKIAQLKPDQTGYNAQKDVSSSANRSNASSSSQALIRNESSTASDLQTNLSKGYDSLSYGNHQPDEKALDRVIGHLNSEAEMRAKRSRKRPEDPDAEVTYINDKNKHFNKKVNRHFDQYTKEIRENFERGTAL